ncbi:hypothetical protein BH10ACT11_BH10ACT11_04780 [soil metagenome]
MSGGSGDDKIKGDGSGIGGAKPDLIRGGSGNDLIFAHARREVVKCGSGRDKVILDGGGRPKLQGCEKIVRR